MKATSTASRREVTARSVLKKTCVPVRSTCATRTFDNLNGCGVVGVAGARPGNLWRPAFP